MTESTKTSAAAQLRCARCGARSELALCTGCAAHEPATMGEAIAQRFPRIANAPPPEMTKTQIAELACAGLGIGRDEWIHRSRIAQWSIWRWPSELAEPGWEERFADAIEAGLRRIGEERAQRITDRVRHALRFGPQALAALSTDELLARIDPRLRPLAEQLTPEQGGRLICGPTGVGKSTALVATVRRLVTENLTAPDPARPLTGIELEWVRAADLPVARLAHGLGEGEAELVQRARDCRILVLDDLGWESRRAGADDVIAEVLAFRYDTGRVTWATTGLRPEQLTEKYSEAVIRRIVEAGGRPGKVIDLWPRESRQ